MKNLFFLALVGLLFAMSSSPPASAALNKVMLENKTDGVAVVDVHYAVCKNDVNVHVPPHTSLQVHAGLCAVTRVTARVKKGGLVHECTAYHGGGRTFYISGNTQSCKVT